MNAQAGTIDPDRIQHSSFSIHHFFALDIDFFNFFRYLLALIVTIYATVITLQSLWGWYNMLAGRDRYIGMVRRYLVVHGLRLRFKAFWGDVVICLLLCVVFMIIWHAHQIIYDISDKMGAVRSGAN
jgi:hypothetical protein